MNKLVVAFFICIANFLFTPLIMAQSGATRYIPVDNKKIQYIGRFYFGKPGEASFMYSASSLRFACTGRSIAIRLQDDGLRNRFTVVLDDSVFHFEANKKDGLYQLATHLADKKHSVEIIRRTEWYAGISRFQGIVLDAGATLVALKKRKRTIEFIGNSNTAAYGIECKSSKEQFSFATQNSYLSYAALTARHFSANCISISRSGIGMYQGYGGDTNFVQPKLYDEIIPQQTFSNTYAVNAPQVVVIALGANDFSAKLDSAAFVKTYIQFVERLLKINPKATFICAVEPCAMQEDCSTFQSYIHAITAWFAAKGKKVYPFTFSPFDGTGCDGHPDIGNHVQMSKELIACIQKLMRW